MFENLKSLQSVKLEQENNFKHIVGDFLYNMGDFYVNVVWGILYKVWGILI